MPFRSKTLAVLAATALAGCLAGCGETSPADQVVKTLEGMGFTGVRYAGSRDTKTTVVVEDVTATGPDGAPFRSSGVLADREPSGAAFSWSRLQFVSPVFGDSQASSVEFASVGVKDGVASYRAIVLQGLHVVTPWGGVRADGINVGLRDGRSIDMSIQQAVLDMPDGPYRLILKDVAWSGSLSLDSGATSTVSVIDVHSTLMRLRGTFAIDGGASPIALLRDSMVSADWGSRHRLGSIDATATFLSPMDGLDLSPSDDDPSRLPDGGAGKTLRVTAPGPMTNVTLGDTLALVKRALAGKPGPFVVTTSTGR